MPFEYVFLNSYSILISIRCIYSNYTFFSGRMKFSSSFSEFLKHSHRANFRRISFLSMNDNALKENKLHKI
jgi:hypothetical protein